MCNCETGGVAVGVGHYGKETVKVQGKIKESILHKLLATATLSASGSAPRSLCKESKGPGCDGQLTLEHRGRQIEVMQTYRLGDRISI